MTKATGFWLSATLSRAKAIAGPLLMAWLGLAPGSEPGQANH